MAIIRNSVFGSISGKVGEGVAYVLNGQEVLRSLPRKRTAPLTEKEKNNRAKFAISQKWLAPLIHFLRIGFKGYQPTYEGFVAAKSYNQKYALRTNEAGEFFMDPELALISFGSLPTPISARVTYTSEQEIVVTWENDSDHQLSDFVMVVFYDVNGASVYGDFGRSKRFDGIAKFDAKNYEIDSEYHVYLAFVSLDMENRSNSMYLGKVAVI